MTTEGMPNDRKMIVLTIQCVEHGLLLGKHMFIILVLGFSAAHHFYFLCLEKNEPLFQSKMINIIRFNSPECQNILI
jgi:hypothetical protein